MKIYIIQTRTHAIMRLTDLLWLQPLNKEDNPLYATVILIVIEVT